MINRWSINLVLVAIIAGATLLVTLKPGKDDAQKTQASITTLAMAEISYITVDRADTKPVELALQEKHWRLLKPVPARANRFNISKLLRLLTTQAEASFDAHVDDLNKYGLDRPHAKIRFNTLELLVGNKHPLKNARYVLINTTVHLVPSHLLRVADSSYNEFISGQLFQGLEIIKAIKLPEVSLSEDKQGWKIRPADDSLSADAINDFVQEWQHASALSVDRYSGKPALATIRLQLAGDGEQTRVLSLGILSYAPEFILYRKDEKLEYRFPEEVGKRLLRPVTR